MSATSLKQGSCCPQRGLCGPSFPSCVRRSLPLRQVPVCLDRFFSQGLGLESFESSLLAIDFVAGSLFGTLLWCAWKVTLLFLQNATSTYSLIVDITRALV